MTLKPIVPAIFGLFASVGLAQHPPAPQINLTGNIGCQGFPCLNNGTLQMPSDANYSMTAVDTSALSLKVTSSVSLTATRNLIYPAGQFMIDVENATTGGQSIQVIGASGTGVVIANGQTVRVWNDGTNFVQVGASGGGGGSPGGTSGQTQYNNGGTFGGYTPSGDVIVVPSTGVGTVKGINGVPLCTGFTPTNGQAIEYTTTSSPNPCYTAATPSGSGPNNFPGTAHQFVTSYNSGTLNFAGAQPAFTDISGVATPAQLPLATGGAFGVIKPDGTSCTVASGVLTCPGSGGYTPPTGTGFPHITGGTQDPAARAVDVSSADITGVLKAAAEPAHTADVTNTAGSLAMKVVALNNTNLAGLATGILKNTTATGVPSIAASTDLAAINGVVTNPVGAQNITQPVVGGVQTVLSVNNSTECTGTNANAPCPSVGRRDEAYWQQQLPACATQICTINYFGDSTQICWGFGSANFNCSAAVGPTFAVNRQVDTMRQKLQNKYGYLGTGFVPVISDVSGPTVNSDMWTISGAITTSSVFGPTQAGVGSTVLITSGETLTFDTTGTLGAQTGEPYIGTDLYVACDQVPGAASTLSMTVDGASVTSPALCGAGSSTARMVHFSGFADTTHTVVFSCGTPPCGGIGGAGWRSGTTGVEISNTAVGSSTSNYYNTANAFAYLDLWPTQPIFVIDAYGGINDSQQSVSPSTFFTNTQTLISHEAVRANGTSVGLVAAPITNEPNAANLPLYKAQQQILVSTLYNSYYTLSFVDPTDQWGTAYTNLQGMYNPSGPFVGLHFSDVGALSMGKQEWDEFFGDTTPPSAATVSGTQAMIGPGMFAGSIDATNFNLAGGAYRINGAWTAKASTGSLLAGISGNTFNYSFSGATAGKLATLNLNWEAFLSGGFCVSTTCTDPGAGIIKAGNGFQIGSLTQLTTLSSANSQIVTCPPGGTTTQYCGADGAWHAAGGGSVSITAASTALTVSPSPITGTGTVDLNLAHANTWTANQTAPVWAATTNMFSPSYIIPAAGTATGGGNFSSAGGYGANGSYWTGSTSNTDQWSWSNVIGAGTNPSATMTFSHTGSPGVASVNIPYPITVNSCSGCFNAGTVLPLSKSNNYSAYGDSITTGQQATNSQPSSPLNTGYAAQIGYSAGGLFLLKATSGFQCNDIQKVYVMATLSFPGSRFPLQSLMCGTNDAVQNSTAPANQLALFGAVHSAVMAHLTLASNQYSGDRLGRLAYQSGLSYVAGEIVTSGGIAYIANDGFSSFPNTGHTPASSPTYWTPYIPPPFFKIAGQAATVTTGTWTPDTTLTLISCTPNCALPAMGNIASANGATITVSVPNPAGNPVMLDYKGMDGNAGTASVTIDGSTPASGPTSLNFFGDSGALFQSLPAVKNVDGYKLAVWPIAATPAACSPTLSSLTTNVATITCANSFVVGQGVTFQYLTNLPFLNGLTATIASASSTQFTVAFTHANVGSAAEAGKATPGHLVTLTITSTPQTVTITNIAIASGVVTGTCSTTCGLTIGSAGYFNGMATNTLLNGATLTVASSSGSTFTASATAGAAASQGGWTTANVSSGADTGSFTVNWIDPVWYGSYPQPPTGPQFQPPNLVSIGLIQNGTAPAAGTAYNAQVLADTNLLISYGAPIQFADVINGNGVLPGLVYGQDFDGGSGLHPNDNGYKKIRDLVEAVMQPPKTFSANSTNYFTDGAGGTQYGITSLSFGTYSFGTISVSGTTTTVKATGANLSGNDFTVGGRLTVASLTTYTPTITNSTAYTANSTENEIRMTNAAARTVTMAASGNVGQTTVIKDSACTASSAPITISVASSGTIDGVANQVINSDCGSLTINWISSGVYETKSPIGNIYGGTVTLTTATTDVATVPGARSTSLCWAMPTNATAATAVFTTPGVWLSSPGANAVTVNHVGTTASGGTMNVLCR